MNPIIEAVDAGHFAHWTGRPIGIKKPEEKPEEHQGQVPGLCQKCGVPYPCEVMLTARKRHTMRLRTEKAG